MWTCTNCGRIFEKTKQPHSCRKIPLEDHFKNKDKAKLLFDQMVKKINKSIGKYRIISLPCCIHLYGKYDFLAALPKKDGLEIRFSLGRVVNSPRLKQSVPMSAKVYKNCFEITLEKEIDDEFIEWLNQSYHLKDKLS